MDALDAAAVRTPEKSEEDALAALSTVRDGATAKRKAATAADEKNWQVELERQKAQWAGKTSPKVGSKGSVYSRSAGRWLACVVVAVGGDEARVKYKLGGQVGEKYVYWGDESEFKLGSGMAARSVVTTTIELTKGPAGYGMEVTDSCHVTGFAGTGSVAEAAGVPVPSRIVEVGGVAVSTKAQLGAALGKAHAAGGAAVPFVFLTKRTAVGISPSGAEEGTPPGDDEDMFANFDAFDDGQETASDPCVSTNQPCARCALQISYI